MATGLFRYKISTNREHGLEAKLSVDEYFVERHRVFVWCTPKDTGGCERVCD